MGFPGPTGCYDIGLPSRLTLFGQLAERAKALGILAKAPVRMLVMTSEYTNAAVLFHFRQNGFFGLAQEDIVFFQQGKFPCFAEDGSILLAAPNKVSWSD